MDRYCDWFPEYVLVQDICDNGTCLHCLLRGRWYAVHILITMTMTFAAFRTKLSTGSAI